MTRIAGMIEGGAVAQPRRRFSGARPVGSARSVRLAVGVLLTFGLLSGCTLLRGPKRDRTEFFALEAVAPAGAPAANAPRVLLRTVELPAYLQRSKAIAVRRAAGEIHYSDLAWWSEPLDLGLARVLRENLNRLGVPTAARRDEEYAQELTVRIEQAEGYTDGKTGRVEFAASFELRRTDGGRAAVIRRAFTAEPAAWDGRDHPALARALSKATADLAAAIQSAQ